MSLETPEKIGTFQRKLCKRAKQEEDFRAYSLYDKIYREDILRHAYRRCRKEGKAAGVDGMTFEQVEEEGLEEWLKDLQEELESGEYDPSPVRRTEIDKPGGGKRPLGIPTIKDRVAQMATKIVIEPLFEADMMDNAHGFRPERSAHDAVEQLHEALCDGKREVVDADLKSYFDTIPHRQLMESVATRIVDSKVLSLIKSWLKVPEREEDENGNRIMTGGKDSERGTPQGGVISPLLSNIYMNRFLKAWEQQGKASLFQAELINYADDFVIATRGSAEQALEWTRGVMEKLSLTLNESKTRICKLDEGETVCFLGYEFGWEKHRKSGSMYISSSPSSKSVDKFKEGLSEFLRVNLHKRWKEVFDSLRRKILGWVNYYCYGTVNGAYREVRNFLYDQLGWYLNRKGMKLAGRIPDAVSGWLKDGPFDPFLWYRKLKANSVWAFL